MATAGRGRHAATERASNRRGHECARAGNWYERLAITTKEIPVKTIFMRTLVGVMLAVAVAFGVPQTQASAATRTTERFATAVWTLTDGCIETQIVVYSSQTLSGRDAGAPENFFYLTQHQTCDDP